MTPRWKSRLKKWEAPAPVRASLFENLAMLGGKHPDIASRVRLYVEDADASVAAAACRVLGTLGGIEDAALLHQRARARRLDARVKQAIMHGLAELEGEAAVSEIIRVARDPLLTVDAIEILGDIGSPTGLRYLRKIAKRHYNGYTRRAAKDAIKAIGKKSKKKKKPKKS